MNTKSIALLSFTLIYIFGAQWWYSNRVAGVCCGPENIPVEEKLEIEEKPIAFQYQEAAPILEENYREYLRSTILKQKTADNILQITGYYYEGEEAPAGIENMGLARAEAIRDLLKDDLPPERIDISSRLMNERDTSDAQTFTGFSYNWRAPLKKEETTIIALEDEVTIYFPFNSSVKDQNQQVDEYLEKLAERLKSSQESVSIIGHTDDVGEEADNERLGLQRAASIEQILRSQGISANRITVASKGERQPATSNQTEEGRHRNRRTVLRIIK